MKSRTSCAFARLLVLFALLQPALSPSANALPVAWIGGDGTWTDGGATNLWNPADEPDADDEAVFNTPNLITLGSSNSVAGVTLSNSSRLNTAGFGLTVDGSISLSGAGTQLTVDASALQIDALVLNNNSTVELRGSTLTLNEEDGNGIIDINVGTSFIGNGIINLTDVLTTPSSLIVHDGVLSVQSEPLIPFTAPPAGSLQINATSVNSRINLDGVGGIAVVNIHRNQTLDINVPLIDAFSDELNLYHNATIDIASPWSVDEGIVSALTGSVPESLPNPAIPAGVAHISGATFTQTGGTISVPHTDGALQINAPYRLEGGSIQVNGRMLLNAATTFNPAVTVTGSGSLLVLSGASLVTADGNNLGVHVRNEGELSVAGDSAAGQLTMDAFSQTSSGQLFLQLGGPEAAESDRLVVEGSATFAGELRVGRLGNLVIEPGDTFTPISYLSRSGTFSIVNTTGIAGLTFLQTYGDTSLTLTAAALLSGDADLNGRVNLRDLVALATHWQSAGSWFSGDFDGNGFVDAHDLGLLAINWQASSNALSFDEAALGLGLPAAIPEPCGLLALVAGLLSLPRRYRRYGRY